MRRLETRTNEIMTRHTTLQLRPNYISKKQRSSLSFFVLDAVHSYKGQTLSLLKTHFLYT